MIIAAESFFFYSGACLFILGFITCFIPRYLRLGIIDMLLGDVLFAAGIAFLLKSTAILSTLGLNTPLFIEHSLVFAVAFALITYLVLFLLFTKFFKKKKSVKKALEQSANADKIEKNETPKADPALFAGVNKDGD